MAGSPVTANVELAACSDAGAPTHRLLDGTRPAFLGRQCGRKAEDLTCEWYDPTHNVVHDMPAPGSPTGEDLCWEGVELDLAACPRREPGFRQWYWSLCKTAKFKSVLAMAGLTEAVNESINCDIKVQGPLMRALLNRFLPETGTFFMQWGEAGFTIEDAMALGKLPLGADCNKAVPAGWEEQVGDMVETMSVLHDSSECKALKGNFSAKFYQKLGTGRFQARHPNLGLRPASEEFEITLFLANWLSFFLFPGQPKRRMRLEMIPLAYRLCHERVDLASPTTASILRYCTEFAFGCRGRVRGKMVPAAPLWLLQLWAFERFLYVRPNPVPWKGDYSAFKSWQNVGQISKATLRNGLDDLDGFHFRPYCGKKIAYHVPAFNGLESVYYEIVEEEVMSGLAKEFLYIITPGHLGTLREAADPVHYVPYRPDRVQRQFGFWQAVPRLFQLRFKAELHEAKDWNGCQIAIPPCGDRRAGCDPHYVQLWQVIRQARMANHKNKLQLCCNFVISCERQENPPRIAFVSSRKGKATRAIAAVLDESPKQPSKPKSNTPRELVDEVESTSKPQPKKRGREENNVAPNVLMERKAKAINDDQPLGKTALSDCTKRRLRFEDELPQEAFDTSTSDHLQVEFVEIERKSNEHKCRALEEQPYNCEDGIAGALDQVISDPIGQPSSSEAEQAEQQVTRTASTSPMLVLAASTHKKAPNNPPALQIEEEENHEQVILDGSPRSNHSIVAEVGKLQVEQQSTQCHQHFGAKRLDKLEIATNLESMNDEALAGLFDLWVERGYMKEARVDGALGKDWFRVHYPSLHAVYPQSPNFSSDKLLAAAFGAKVAAIPWWLAYVETMSRIGSLQNITYSIGVIDELWSLVNKLKVLQERRFDVRVPQGKLRHLVHGLMRDLPVPIDIPIVPDENAVQQHLQAVKDLGKALEANERQHNEYKAREVTLRDELDWVLVTLRILEENRMCLSATLAEEQLAADNIAKAQEEYARAEEARKELVAYEAILKELSAAGGGMQ